MAFHFGRRDLLDTISRSQASCGTGMGGARRLCLLTPGSQYERRLGTFIAPFFSPLDWSKREELFTLRPAGNGRFAYHS